MLMKWNSTDVLVYFIRKTVYGCTNELYTVLDAILYKDEFVRWLVTSQVWFGKSSRRAELPPPKEKGEGLQNLEFSGNFVWLRSIYVVLMWKFMIPLKWCMVGSLIAHVQGLDAFIQDIWSFWLCTQKSCHSEKFVLLHTCIWISPEFNFIKNTSTDFYTLGLKCYLYTSLSNSKAYHNTYSIGKTERIIVWWYVNIKRSGNN